MPSAALTVDALSGKPSLRSGLAKIVMPPTGVPFALFTTRPRIFPSDSSAIVASFFAVFRRLVLWGA